MAFDFGPFRVLARIAVGPTAQTFVALEEAGDQRRVVCLKTLLPQLSAVRRARKQFGDEAQIAARLRHPVCVEVEKWGEEDGICWVSMAYVTGETWEDILANAEPIVPVNEVAFVIADLCAGLQYAHTLKGTAGPYNIVHRGICSKNILVTDDGRPRIMDFGTGKSRMVNDATETGIIKGSFRYMSPEQILGRDPDHRSDIYSLGEVLFESLTGPLSTGGGLEEIATAKLDGHPRLKDLVPGVHPDLDNICKKALEVETKDRYAQATDMRTALVEYIGKLQRKPTRESVTKLLQRMFGNRITRRAEVLRKLAFGDLDTDEICEALRAEPVTRKDVFDGPGGGYNEAAFLATLRPGHMQEQTPLARSRTKPAEAKLKLRAPNRSSSTTIPDPPPPTEMRPIDRVADAPTDALILDDLDDLDLHLPDLDISDVPTHYDEGEDETGVVDPEPTGIFRRGDFKS